MAVLIDPANVGAVAVVRFARPVMLAGLAVVLAPVLIHLISRGLPRTLVFPTIRFLRDVIAAQSRLHRWRHRMLMLLRCACLALIVLAFARPLWFDSAEAAATADRDTVALILLDASASMGYADASVSTMDRAIARADAVLGSLQPARGDHANLVSIALAPRPAFVRPTADLAALRRQLHETRATAERAEIAPAIDLAAGQLAEFRSSRRELHVISDFQATNWKDADFSRIPSGTHIEFHPIGAEDRRPNTAITEIVTEPPRPIARRRCRVTIRLASFSPRATRTDVLLRSGEGRVWKQPQVSISPDSPVSTSFDIEFARAGVHELTAEIPPDSLGIDDRRYAAVHVTERLPVLLCSDSGPNDGVTAAYLLTRALVPFEDARDTIDLRTARAGELSEAVLHGVDVVLLETAQPIPASGLRALARFLEQGGGVAAFLGPGAAAENLLALNGLFADNGLLPLRPGDVLIANTDARPARILLGTAVAHPLLQPLGSDGVESLQAVSVLRHFATLPGRASAETIATLDTGHVAIGAVSAGSGRLLVCNLSPDPAWTDLARHTVFPGLVHQIVSLLQPVRWARPPCFVGAGAAARWPLTNVADDVEIREPGGRPVRIAARRDGPTATADLPPAAGPGFYRVRAGDRLLKSVAVNLDPIESDLTALPPDRLRTHPSRGTVAAGDQTSILENRRGRPLWPWALAAAMTALGVEMLFLLLGRR